MFIFLNSHVTHCTLIFILTFVQSEINWQAFNGIIYNDDNAKQEDGTSTPQNKPKHQLLLVCRNYGKV